MAMIDMSSFSLEQQSLLQEALIQASTNLKGINFNGHDSNLSLELLERCDESVVQFKEAKRGLLDCFRKFDLGGVLINKVLPGVRNVKAFGGGMLEAFELGHGAQDAAVAMFCSSLLRTAVRCTCSADKTRWVERYGTRLDIAALCTAGAVESVHAGIIFCECSTVASAGLGVFLATGAIAAGITAYKWHCAGRETDIEDEARAREELDPDSLPSSAFMDSQNLAFIMPAAKRDLKMARNCMNGFLRILMQKDDFNVEDHEIQYEGSAKLNDFKAKIRCGEVLEKCRIEVVPNFFIWIFPGKMAATDALRFLKLSKYDWIFKFLTHDSWEEADLFKHHLVLPLIPHLMEKTVCLMVDVDGDDMVEVRRQFICVKNGILNGGKEGEAAPEPETNWMLNWMHLSSTDTESNAGVLFGKLLHSFMTDAS